MKNEIMTNSEMSKQDYRPLSYTEVILKSTGHLWKYNAKWDRWENWR